MSAWTCEQVEPLIDLYAADECDAPVRSAVERHLTACAACRASSRQARQLLGLLDERFQESERLHRLWARLDAEPWRVRRTLPAAWRFAAIAAAVLAAFGLSAWVGPAATPAPRVQLAASLSPPLARMAPMEMVVRNDMPPKAPAARQGKDAMIAPVFSLDLGGKAPAEFRRGLRAAGEAADLPPPPAVDLVLDVHNDGRDILPLRFGDEWTVLSLDLNGPGAVSVAAPGAAPPWPNVGVARLGPGETLRLPIRRLAYGSRGAVRYAYWTEPGEYTLAITLCVPMGTNTLAGAREVETTTGSIRIRVVGQ